MRTKDIKVNSKYLYSGEEVTVLKRIKPKGNNKQFGRGLTRFKLCTGEEVYASDLEELEK